MKLKKKIAAVAVSVLMGMMIVPQLSFAAEDSPNGDIDLSGIDFVYNDPRGFECPVYILDYDDFKYIAPGQTGIFQTGFNPIGNVQPTGTIELYTVNPPISPAVNRDIDIVSVDKDGAWEAKREGFAQVFAKYSLSDETWKELVEQDPEYSSLFADTFSGLDIYVTNCNSIFRMYNPNSGEHFYTTSSEERKALVKAGWSYERISWLNANDRLRPVYRLYNPNAGDHHYTMDEVEANELTRLGWENEGIAMYADENTDTRIYRLYNPNATTGAHHFTASFNERDVLESFGWINEGIAFYANSEIGVQQELLRGSN